MMDAAQESCIEQEVISGAPSCLVDDASHVISSHQEEDLSTDETHRPTTLNEMDSNIVASTDLSHCSIDRESGLLAYDMLSDSENMFSESENEIPIHQDGSSSSDNDSDDDEVGDIKDKLKEWVINSKVPLVHVNTLLQMLRPHFPTLPKDARTLLATPKHQDLQTLAGGQYHHFGIANGVTARFDSSQHLSSLNEVSVQVNVDGLPLFKSSSVQFWPILGILKEDKDQEPFIIGLWVGVTKPKDSNDYLQPFVEELKTIQSEGVSYLDRKLRVNILNFVCDTPARAFVKKVKGHTGYYGCDKCTQRGVWNNHRMTFPEDDSAVRTDVSFDEMVNEDHHHSESILSQLQLGMVTQFPLDFMHLVCLGVVKKLISLWISGPLTVRVGVNSTCRQISEALINLGAYLPREFVRKGRSLQEIDRWKATEFRTFILYTGIVALK